MTASASTTLIAGVATLLLALGVGVLIGENNAPAPVAQKPTVINVPAASSGGTVTSATTTPSTSSGGARPTGSTGAAAPTGKSSSKAAKPSSKATAKAPVSASKAPSAAAVSAANQAAAKTLDSKNVGNATAQPGQSCTAGTPGCVGGKQTTQLFGGAP